MSVALTLSTQKSHRVLATASLEQVLQFSSQSQQTFTALRSVTTWPQDKSILAIVGDLHIYMYLCIHLHCTCSPAQCSHDYPTGASLDSSSPFSTKALKNCEL